MSSFVSAHESHYALIWLKGVDKKVPPLFYLNVCLRHFGAPSGRAFAQYIRCSVSHSLKRGQGAGQKKGTFDA